MKKLYLAALASVAMAGCAHAADEKPPRLSERQAAELARALDGKSPGEPESCVMMNRGTRGLHAVGDDVVLYEINSKLVYRNDLMGTCHGLDGNTMVIKPTNNQYCRGDILRVVDTSTGMNMGSCALGSFVPYRAP